MGQPFQLCLCAVENKFDFDDRLRAFVHVLNYETIQLMGFIHYDPGISRYLFLVLMI